MNDNLKELLTRICKGCEINITNLTLPKDFKTVLQKADSLRNDLGQEDVLKTIKILFPDLVNVAPDRTLSDKELLAICLQGCYKDKALMVDSMITSAIMKYGNVSTYNWKGLLEEVQGYITEGAALKNDFFMMNNLVWERMNTIASFGYPALDLMVDGGITASSYTIIYAATNVGKSTIGTVQIVANLLKQGLKPLIISLEFEPIETATNIYMAMLGMSDKDPRKLNHIDRSRIEALSKKYPNIPIINHSATYRWQMDSYIRTFKPDVIIYDQLTLGAKSKEVKDMSNLSTMLKNLAAETTIPVIAMTQSDEQPQCTTQYNEAGEDAEVGANIKYARSIAHDARTVIYIGYGYMDKERKRVLSIVKTKDRNTARQDKNPKIGLLMTPNGMQEDWVTYDGRKWNVRDFITKYKEILGNAEMEYIKTEDAEVSVDVVEVLHDGGDRHGTEKVQSVPVPVERNDPSSLDLYISGDYNEDRLSNTGARLREVGRHLNIPFLIGLGDTFDDNNTTNYANKFLSHRSFDYSKDKAFAQYYHGGSK